MSTTDDTTDEIEDAYDDPEELLRENDEIRELFQRIAGSDAQSASHFEGALPEAGVYDDAE